MAQRHPATLLLLSLCCAVSVGIVKASANATSKYPWAHLSGNEPANQLFLAQLANATAGAGSKLVVYGDSILQCLGIDGYGCDGVKEVGARRLAPYNPLVFAVGGDTADSTMGKMLNGIVPKGLGKDSGVAVLVNIGHNGMGTLGGGVELTADKVKQIIEYILSVDPDNQVIAMSMLPSTGGDGGWVGSGTYAPSKYMDQQMQALAANNSRVHFANCEPLFLNATTNFTYTHKYLLPDGVHPSALGYEIIVDCITPYLKEITGIDTVAARSANASAVLAAFAAGGGVLPGITAPAPTPTPAVPATPAPTTQATTTTTPAVPVPASSGAPAGTTTATTTTTYPAAVGLDGSKLGAVTATKVGSDGLPQVQGVASGGVAGR